MYFYNIKLLDLKKKKRRKKKNLLNSSKNETGRYLASEPGTFASETAHQRRMLRGQPVEKFKLFLNLFHLVYLVIFLFLFSISLFSIANIYIFLKK